MSTQEEKKIFTKYNSIENSYRKEFVEQMIVKAPPGTIWMIQEKVHGANFSIIYDKSTDTVHYAKRTGLLGPKENFYNCLSRLPEWEALTRTFVQRYDGRFERTLVIRGEMCGGRYPGVKNLYKPVQKGVDYCPGIEFVAFDLQLDDVYAPLNTAMLDLQQAGFHIVRILKMCDTLQEARNFDTDFSSKLPEEEFGMLPHPGKNQVEGIVIKPREAFFLNSGARAVIKKKNDTFKEVASAPKTSSPKEEKFPEVINYVVEARYHSVSSKYNDDADIKTLGLAMIQDVMDDYLKDHSIGGDKKVRKELRRKISRLVYPFIKKMLNNF